MKNKFMIIACCLLLIVTTACSSNPKLENGEEVIASVDGKEISVDELYNNLKSDYGYESLLSMIDQYIADKEIETTDEIKEYAQQIVDYYVSYAEAFSMDLETFLTSYVGVSGIATEEDFLQYIIDDYKVSLAIRKQIATKFTDEEIENYYKENYSEQLTVRHILIEIEESDKDGSKALAEAKKLIKTLNSTDKDKVEDKFIELAKEYSDDSSYSDGGLIEDFMSSTVVKEFWEASESLKDGEYTKTAILTDYGYHIIYRVSSKDKPALEEAKDKILDALTDEALEEDELLYYVAMNELREKYNLKIYDTDLKTSYNDYLSQLETSN